MSYLKLKICRQLLCWILIARHLNINKNISHRPEVQRTGAPKLPKCDSSSTGMFVWSKCITIWKCKETRLKLLVGFVLNWKHFVAPFRRKCLYKKIVTMTTETLRMELFKYKILLELNFMYILFKKTTKV